ncbi:DUF6037 family protein [Vagococcus fluvialis]|uniref:DUF6037 family protein n=1 Tax=Vagococcus fluvialis TaxID=2738 RepID=UPI0037D209BD
MNNEEFCLGRFNFNYNDVDCASIISIDKKDLNRSTYTSKAKLIIFNQCNEKLEAYVHTKGLSFPYENYYEIFCDFFRITRGNGKTSFKILNDSLLNSMNFGVSIDVDNFGDTKDLLIEYASRKEDSKNPDRIYCTGLKLNSLKDDSTREQRTSFNDAKSRISRRVLYMEYGQDKNISFNYSIDKKDEKTDFEIIRNFNNNHPNYVVKKINIIF